MMKKNKPPSGKKKINWWRHRMMWAFEQVQTGTDWLINLGEDLPENESSRRYRQLRLRRHLSDGEGGGDLRPPIGSSTLQATWSDAPSEGSSTRRYQFSLDHESRTHLVVSFDIPVSDNMPRRCLDAVVLSMPKYADDQTTADGEIGASVAESMGRPCDAPMYGLMLYVEDENSNEGGSSWSLAGHDIASGRNQLPILLQQTEDSTLCFESDTTAQLYFAPLRWSEAVNFGEERFELSLALYDEGTSISALKFSYILKNAAYLTTLPGTESELLATGNEIYDNLNATEAILDTLRGVPEKRNNSSKTSTAEP
mmetsp:Transcript_10815/g.19380  ORF Transcript_10815/g.19380 Transcript_10815/m.19380 type:complete len:312 (+) Transcript_10815:1691-2626(+)